VAPTHEIFHKPLNVQLEWEERNTPENYRHWPGGEKLGKTIKVWKVATKKFPEIDPGLVSDPYGFEDSPDAEVISSGLNGKAPNSVALARHGNFFLWGFAAQPSDMTPEARKCFVNSVCYIKKFDGQKPLVRKNCFGREWMLVYAGYLKTITDEKYIERNFPEEVRKPFGTDAEKYLAYYRENREYLHPMWGVGTPGSPDPPRNLLAVDEDVKRLYLSNRKVGLLKRCVSLLEKGEEVKLARRVLKRYTNEQFADAKEWRDWLDKNRDRLFFSDVGGYKFFVAPEGKQAVAGSAKK
jgi:hypothetical protein